MKPTTLACLCAASALLGASSSAQELRLFEDRQTFLAVTLGADVSGPLADCSGLTCGEVTFSTGIIGCWTPLLEGDDLAISGVENLDLDFEEPVYAFGIEMVEHTNPTGNCTIGGCNAPCTQSTFRVQLFTEPGGAQVGPSRFFRPRDDVATFIGVASTAPFRHVEIRETVGTDDNEQFGRVYASTRPLATQSTVTDGTIGSYARPGIATLPDQTSLVAWRTEDQTIGRIIDDQGTVSGDEVEISTIITEGSTPLSVAASTTTDFVVVWARAQYGGGPYPTDLFGQKIDSSGAKIGSEFQVNTYTTNNQYQPAVAAADHGFLVVWASDGSNTADVEGTSIIGRLFQSDGTPDGDEFLINTSVPGNQTRPAVAASSNEFIVVWEDANSTNIRGQRISTAGQAIGNEFLVNNLTTGPQSRPSVARHHTGSFVVTWESRSSYQGDTSQTYSIQARRYTPTGGSIGSQFQINSYFPGDQRYPHVALGANRNFMVVWQSEDSPGTDDEPFSVLARRFDAVGSPIGDDFQINSATDYSQTDPRVVVGGGSEFLVVWTSVDEELRQPTEGIAISFSIEKLFLPATDILFEDHEDGHGSGWSDIQP